MTNELVDACPLLMCCVLQDARTARALALSVRMPTTLEHQLVSRAPSQHGRRWRSLVCAVTRNEGHLREWLLRTLHVGVSHIVLVDDNHVGVDQDISALLGPLIALGLVTHAPSARCGEQCASQKSWVSRRLLSNTKPLPTNVSERPMPCRDIAGRRACQDTGMRARTRQPHGLAATGRYGRAHLRGARGRDARRTQPRARAPRARGRSRRAGAVVYDVRRAVDSGGADLTGRRPDTGISSRTLGRAGAYRQHATPSQRSIQSTHTLASRPLRGRS